MEKNTVICPVCSGALRRGFCPSCGYDESADFLMCRTLQPAGGMDVLKRWTCYAGIEMRRGAWRFRFDENRRAILVSANGSCYVERNFLLDTCGKRLLRYLGNDPVPVVPEGVEEISEKAFERSGVRSVILSDGLRVIGSSAFTQSDLSSLVLPDGLQILGAAAFQGSRLEKIVIPGSIMEIGRNAFMDCRHLLSVTIDPGVARIGVGAFSGCDALERIVIPDSVLEIESYAFYNCPKLRIEASEQWRRANPSLSSRFAEPLRDTPQRPPASESDNGFHFANFRRVLLSYTGTDLYPAVPEGTVEIGQDAFAGKNVESVVLPPSVRIIGEGAFRSSSLETIALPAELKELRERAFSRTFLKAADIPGSVREIGANAFFDCDSLKSVRLRDGVRKICAGAFGSCAALRTVEIPDSVEEVEAFAFYNSPVVQIAASDSWKALHSELAMMYYKHD